MTRRSSQSNPPLSLVRDPLRDSNIRPRHSSIPAAKLPSGGESLVNALVALGVDTFFVVPGGPVMPVVDAIIRNPNAECIEPRHESHGAFQAAGYHRASGRTAAVVVTAGPGATNVITGVVSAHIDSVPMIVIVGEVATATSGRRLVQSVGDDGVGIERMLAGVTRGVFRVMNVGSIASVALAAFERATDRSNPGPAVIVVPIEHASAAASVPELHTVRPTVSFASPLPPRELLVTLATKLRAAKRPLVVVGAGCRDAASVVLAMVESMQCPFVTSPHAKGALPETHPLSLRNAGISSSHWARNYCAEGPDFTIALGTDLDDATTAGTPPIRAGGTLVHVTSDASIIGRNYETAFGITCDVMSFAKAFREAVRTIGGSPVGLALATAVRTQSPFDVPSFDSDDQEPIAPHRIIADLEDACPPDTTFVSDIGEHMLFALHYLTVGGMRRFVINIGLGSMASGIASSVGVALGDRSRAVVCICGDGGMHMAGAEILVALKRRLPIVFAVFNDARYNMVFHGYRLTFGRESAWDTPQIDFVQWAAALGARGARIDRPGQITREMLLELTAGGIPAVLDIRHDASVRIGGDGRLEALRQMSMSATPGDSNGPIR